MNDFIKALNEIEEQQDRDTDKFFEDINNGKPAKMPAFVLSYGDKSISFPLESADIYAGFISCINAMRECCENLTEADE